MSGVILAGDTSGSVTLQAPAVAGSTVLTLPAQTGTVMVNGPAFSAYQSIGQSLSAGVYTKVQLQTDEFDTNSNFDSTTNYRFTPTVDGYYQVNWMVFVLAAATQILPVLYKNGAAYKIGSYILGANPTGNSASLVYLNGSTDYIELYVLSGAAATTNPSIANTYFNAAMIRSA